MAPKSRLAEDELLHQVRTHLVYELKWLIYAADAFQRAESHLYVALLDSAAVHARNLLEFVVRRRTGEFTLDELGGVAQRGDAWEAWVNNRVTHMGGRAKKAPWPEGREAWDRPDKLMRLAAVVLERLREGGASIASSRLRESFDAVLASATDYLDDPTEQRHQALAVLYDGSRDEPYPD
jgi:hypothetical protein